MLKLTKTGIGLLTRQYRSVLKKCWLINVGIWNLVTNLVSNVATAIGGVMSTLRGSSKNSAKEFLELIAALQNCNFLNDEVLKNTANNFIETIKLPAAEMLNTLTGGTFLFVFQTHKNVLDDLFAKRGFKQKLITTTAIGLAVTAITMPTEAEAAYVWDWDNRRLLISTIDANYAENGLWIRDANTNKTVVQLWYGGEALGGALELTSGNQNNKTYLTNKWFSLNNSSRATGIDFASNVNGGTTDASHLATTGSVTQMLSNNYYRKDKKSGILNGFEEGEKGNEIGDNFSKLAANDNFHLVNDGIFSNQSTTFDAKVAENVPAAELRFNIANETGKEFAKMPFCAPTVAGTSIFFQQKNIEVLDNFYKNSQCLKASNDNFAITTFLRAI